MNSTRLLDAKSRFFKLLILSSLTIALAIVLLNLRLGWQVQADINSSLAQTKYKIYLLSADLKNCYYSGDYSPELDKKCINQLAEISILIDYLPIENRTFALIWSGTHSYLDAKYYDDFSRISTKALVESEIETLATSKEKLLSALKKKYTERLQMLRRVIN